MNVRRLLLAGALCVALLGVAACGGRQAPDARGGLQTPVNPSPIGPSQPAQDMPAQVPPVQNPAPSPADDEDGEFSILPAPADDDGASLDPLVTPFRPVDERFVNWDAAGPDPVEVAKQFVLGDQPCDCADTSAVLFEEIGDHAVVEVALAGLRDDSVRDRLYRITLTKADGVWMVAGAEQQDTCHRGVGDSGLCT